jgi:hypothetical protein
MLHALPARSTVQKAISAAIEAGELGTPTRAWQCGTRSPASQRLMANQAMGKAMKRSEQHRPEKSRLSKQHDRSGTSAPSTFRMPISRMRWLIANTERSSRPRQAMNSAIAANTGEQAPLAHLRLHTTLRSGCIQEGVGQRAPAAGISSRCFSSCAQCAVGTSLPPLFTDSTL